MNWEIIRLIFEESYTLGKLSCSGKFVCYTLEPRCIDWATEQKVPGKTAIPAGVYNVCMCWSPKFKRKMPYLMNVPHFEGIMFHTGNTAERDSKGCILVGLENLRGVILRSKEAFNKIMEKMEYARKSNQNITLTIK